MYVKSNEQIKLMFDSLAAIGNDTDEITKRMQSIADRIDQVKEMLDEDGEGDYMVGFGDEVSRLKGELENLYSIRDNLQTLFMQISSREEYVADSECYTLRDDIID